MKELADRIRQARRRAGMKQTDLAEKSNLSVPTISRYENGERSPTANDLLVLAAVLDTSIAYLMGETDDPTSSGIKQVAKSGSMEPEKEKIHFEYRNNGETVVLDFPEGTPPETMRIMVEAAKSGMTEDALKKKDYIEKMYDVPFGTAYPEKASV